MMKSSEDLRAVLVKGIPLVDVRAPIEFAKGSVPGAVNLPVLNDSERAEVGTTYKLQGQDAAIELGRKLVSGQALEERMAAWETFARTNPNAAIYCFRGGLRSRSVQAALREIGLELPLLEGGYKRVRQLFLEAIETLTKTPLVVLSGFTGTGKTSLLNQLSSMGPARAMDLEGFANHRGSAFGKKIGGQPSQADFENRLGLEVMRLPRALGSRVVIEDESRMIGRIVIPDSLFAAMSTAPVVVLERPVEDRARLLVKNYVEENYGLFEGDTNPEKIASFHRDLHVNISSIQKRLGGLETSRLLNEIDTAIAEQLRSGSLMTHLAWVERLLETYYDPVYRRHLESLGGRIVARGNEAEIQAYLSNG